MKIRFGTFNLFQFIAPPFSFYIKKDKFTQEQWIEKKEWIKKQIIKMQCDIIGFQEVFSTQELQDLLQELGYHYFKTVDSVETHEKNPNIFTSTLVAIASKYPITKTQKVKTFQKAQVLHHAKGKFHFSRVPIKAYIKLPNNEEIIVYVAHLKSNRLNEFEYIFSQKTSIKEKKELILNQALKQKFSFSLQQRLCEVSNIYFDLLNNKDIPTLFLCDLNDKEYSMTIDALCNPKYYSFNQKALLYDAYYFYKPKIYNPHPDMKEIKRVPTSYFLGKGNVLDYIFVSKHLKDYISDYCVLDSHLKHNNDGSLTTSDHAQVICEITF